MLRFIFRPLLNTITRLSRFIKINIINRKKNVSIIDFVFILHKAFRDSYLYKLIIFIYTIAVAFGAIVTLATMYNDGFDLYDLQGRLGTIKNNFIKIYGVLFPNDKLSSVEEDEDIGNPFPYGKPFDYERGNWVHKLENEYHWYKDPYIITGGILLIILLGFFGLTNSYADGDSGSIMSFGRIKSGFSNILKNFKLYFNSIYESSKEAGELRDRENSMLNIESSIDSFKLKDLDPTLFGKKEYYQKIRTMYEDKYDKLLPEYLSEKHMELIKTVTSNLKDYSSKLNKEYFDKLSKEIKDLNNVSDSNDPFKTRLKDLSRRFNGEEVVDLTDIDDYFTTPKPKDIKLEDARDVTPKASTSKLPEEEVKDLKSQAEASSGSAKPLPKPEKLTTTAPQPEDTPRTAEARLDAASRLAESEVNKPSLSNLFGDGLGKKLRKTVTNDRSGVIPDLKGKSKAIEDAKAKLDKVETNDRSKPILTQEPVPDKSIVGALNARRGNLGMLEDQDNPVVPAGQDWPESPTRPVSPTDSVSSFGSDESFDRKSMSNEYYRTIGNFRDPSPASPQIPGTFNPLKGEFKISNPETERDHLYNKFLELFYSKMNDNAPSVVPSPLPATPKLTTFDNDDSTPSGSVEPNNPKKEEIESDYSKMDFDGWLSKQDKHMRIQNEDKFLSEYSKYGVEFNGSHNETQAILRSLKLKELLNTPQSNSPKLSSEVQVSNYTASYEQPFNPHLALIEKLNDRTKLTEEDLTYYKDLTEGSVLWNPNTKSYVMYTEGRFELLKLQHLNAMSDISELSPDKVFEQLNIIDPDNNKTIKLDRPELGFTIETTDTADLNELQVIFKKLRLIKGESEAGDSTIKPSEFKGVHRGEITIDPID